MAGGGSVLKGVGLWCGFMQLYDSVMPIVLCVIFLNR